MKLAVKCRTCGRNDHNKTKCPQNINCKLCGRKGHSIFICPENVRCKLCNNFPESCWCLGERRDKRIMKRLTRPVVGQVITYNKCSWCKSSICLCDNIS